MKCESCGQELPKKVDLTELRKVVMTYKIASGFDPADKGWDKLYFRIYTPIAKKLIEFLGSWKDAADCVQDTVEAIHDWNPEATISMHKILMKAGEWKKNKQEREGKRGIHTQQGNGTRQAQSGTNNQTPDSGEEPGEMLHAI